MTIAVLCYSTGEVDIIRNVVNLRTNEEVENYLAGVLEYNLDEVHYMFSRDLQVNDLTPMDFEVDDEEASRFGVIANAETLFRQFKNYVGCEPHYARCRIRFDTDGSEEDVVIKLTSDEDEKDDEIFFYCDGLDDLVRLCYAENGEDFDLIELVEYFNKL